MTAEREEWLAVLFDQVAGRPAGARDAFIEMACGHDAELRFRLKALLDANAAAGGFLQETAQSPCPRYPRRRGPTVHRGSRMPRASRLVATS